MNLNSKVKHAPPITSHFFGFWLSTQAEEGPPSTGNTPPMHNCSTSPNSIPFHTNASIQRAEGFFVVVYINLFMLRADRVLCHHPYALPFSYPYTRYMRAILCYSIGAATSSGPQLSCT
jgi:hypothetical protein